MRSALGIILAGLIGGLVAVAIVLAAGYAMGVVT